MSSGPRPIFVFSFLSQSQNGARQMMLAGQPTGITRLCVEDCPGLLLKSSQDFSLAPAPPSKNGMPLKFCDPVGVCTKPSRADSPLNSLVWSRSPNCAGETLKYRLKSMDVNFSDAGVPPEPSVQAAPALVCRAIKANVGTPEPSVCRKSLRDHSCFVSMSCLPCRDPARRILSGV